LETTRDYLCYTLSGFQFTLLMLIAAQFDSPFDIVEVLEGDVFLG